MFCRRIGWRSRGLKARALEAFSKTQIRLLWTIRRRATQGPALRLALEARGIEMSYYVVSDLYIALGTAIVLIGCLMKLV